ncbi:hypothetical protein B0G81_6234 [Paraburkholderia sp. BL6665CI2N2]|uniref:hypothetical protein n=1 Tax=Paraburkholderia sp. BL6665CI2N2 TaxID=1938806 RepID=UPI001065E537|nr:hypothetical protein [Paraburkholderia sp. BL6665CI2N2]TDY25751.1 hypothetical protein B0G81_6234 [Paraburkholderia sp. BL6665CI2N2]
MADLIVPNSDTSFAGPVTPQPATAPTPAAAYLQSSAGAAQSNVALAIGANPDYEAEMQQLARQTGVPVDSVKAFPDQVKQKAAVAGTDWQTLAKQFPTTAAFYQSQNNALIAHDDVHNLANVEAAANGNGVPLAPGTTGYFQPDNSPLPLRTRIADWARNLIGPDASSLVGLDQTGNAQGAGAAQASAQVFANQTGTPLDDQREAVGGMNPAPVSFARGFFHSFLAGATPDAAPSGNTTADVAAGAGNLAGFITGAPLKLAEGAVERVGGSLLEHAAGESFAKAAVKDVAGQAATLGTASALTSVGDSLNQTSGTDAFASIGRAGASGAAMGGVFGVAGRTLPDNTILQTTARVLGVNAAMDALNGTNPFDSRPTAQKAFDYALNTMFSLQGQGRAGGGWLTDAAKADIATSDAASLSNLVGTAATSKLRTRDPQAFSDFVKQASDNGPIQNVYVDGTVLANALNQSGITADELNQKLPDVAEQLQTALQTNGQVSIPVEDFATHFADPKLAGELIPNLRTDPEGMTQNEAQAFYQSHADQFRNEAQNVFNADEMQTAHELSAQVVGDNVRNQLDTANRFPAETNDAYSKLVQSFYSTTAGRLGMTPEQMFAAYPLRISEGVPGANALDQEARGKLSFPDDVSSGPSTITLLKGADLSTFLHESGHHFLNVLDHVSQNGPDTLKADMQHVADWFGTTPDAWRAMTLEQKRPMHEQFARGFEAYLREGKSPSLEMQGVFQRFRAWLVNVYKSIGDLKVQLSPEVRGVFDRLLATNDDIVSAETARAYMPLFKSADEAGMTPDDYAQYRELGNEATLDAVQKLGSRTLRDMKWLEGKKADALRNVQSDVAAKRDAAEAEVEREIAAEPIYQADQFIRNGSLIEADRTNKQRRTLEDTSMGSTKLSLPDLKEMYGEGEAAIWRYLPTGKHGLAATEGVHPDTLADLFGFGSGDELVRNLLAAEPFRDVVQAVTDRRMLEKHGDITSPDAMSRAADAAIHNEARARFIATEFRALNKATGPVREITRAAKDAAERTIATTRVKNLRPAQYTAAETRAAKQAEKARMAGDVPTAAKAKRDQLLNNQLAKVATDAAEEVQRTLEYLKRFGNKTTRAAIGADYMEQIDALLDRWDLRTGITAKERARRLSLLDWVQSQEAQGFEPAIPSSLLNEAMRGHYKDMTLEAFRGLADSIRSIDHLGRLKQTLLDNQDAREFDAIREEAVAQMKQLKQRAPDDVLNPGEGGKGADAIRAMNARFKSAVKSGDASLLKMEQVMDWLDNHDPQGVFNRVVFRRIADAEARENDLRKDITAKFKDAFDAVPDEVTKDFSNRYTMPELRDEKTGEPTSMLKSEVIAMALNTGNESNYSKLLEGKGWSDQAVQRVLNRHMSKGDWDLVQRIWHTIDTLWPEIEALEKRVSGVAPPKVQPRAVRTPHGTYEGGYYPVVYDPLRSFTADRNKGREADLFAANYTKATTRHGYTNERIDEYKAPLYLSMEVLPRHVGQVIHDIAYREAIMDAHRFLSDSKVREGVENTLGREYYAQFTPWLKAIANDRNVDNREVAFWENFIRAARTNATMVGLGYRLTTILKHGGAAALNSVGEIGPRWMASGVNAFRQDMAGTRDFVFERSGEMRHRMEQVDRDVRDLIRNVQIDSQSGPVSAATKTLNAARRYGYYGISMIDMASAMPTWMGAYTKGLHENMTEQEAIYYADKAVRNAHGGGGTKDQAAIQRGSEFQKAITMFYSFFNHFYNRQRDIGRSVVSGFGNVQQGDFKAAGGDFARVLAKSFWYFAAVAAWDTLIKGTPHSESFVAHFAKELAGLGLAGVPLVRDIAPTLLHDQQFSATPLAQAAQAISNVVKDGAHAATGGKVQHPVAHAVQAAGYAFGLPVGQATTTGRFLWDATDGQQRPQDIAGWFHGLVSGRADAH